MKTIYIDTSDNKEIVVGLIIDDRKFLITKPLEKQKSQIVLSLIEEVLQNHTLTFQDIHTIEVNPGPGSFTGVRVGVSVANALSFSLGIPVNGINVAKEDRIVKAKYN